MWAFYPTYANKFISAHVVFTEAIPKSIEIATADRYIMVLWDTFLEQHDNTETWPSHYVAFLEKTLLVQRIF